MPSEGDRITVELTLDQDECSALLAWYWAAPRGMADEEGHNQRFARFLFKSLQDGGWVPTSEEAQRLGML